MAAVYHFKLCRAILVGFRNQLRRDGVCKDVFVGMLESGMEGEEVPAVLPCFHLTNDKGSILKVQIESDKVFPGRLDRTATGPGFGEGCEEEGIGILRWQGCMGVTTH